MNAAPTNRELAAVARRAAEVIQERGKAAGVSVDHRRRVCTIQALVIACDEVADGHALVPIIDRLREARPLGVALWSDLPTTTEQDIAKVFLQVADDLEVAP